MINALIIRRNTQRAKTEKTLRAAQYVRMSTDNQKYSPANQRSAIAAYAAQRGITIVRSYADEGRSGLTISGRAGLDALIRDVQGGHADFSCILVYDVSRWGRFQDVDERAYYEFICKRAENVRFSGQRLPYWQAGWGRGRLGWLVMQAFHLDA